MPMTPTLEMLVAHTKPQAPPPFSEGAAWLAALPKAEVTAIFGYSAEVAAAIEPGRRVIFLEEDLAIIAGAGDVEIHLLEADPEPLFFHLAETNLLKGITTACLPRCQHLTARAFELEHAFAMQRHLSEEHLDGARAFCANFFANLRHLPTAHRASALYGQFENVPAIICGAGPSLAKHELGFLRERALILAGGTAIAKVGAQAHAGAALDPNGAQSQMLMGSGAHTLPLFYRGRLHRGVLGMWQGPHLYTGGAGGYPLAGYFERELGIAQPEVEEGFNVICYLTSIAERLGCNPILFVGMDLCDEQGTQWKWLSEGQWISRFAKRSRATLINCTEGGMGIGDLPAQPLLEALPQRRWDLEGRLRSKLVPLGVTQTEIDAVSEKFSNSLRRSLQLFEVPRTPLSEFELDSEAAYRYHLEVLGATYTKIGAPEKLKEAAQICLKSML